MWWLFAVGSAVFAALTSILAKIGIEGVNSNLATAIRTVVVVITAWGMVFPTGLDGFQTPFMTLRSQPVHPTQLYELILALIGIPVCLSVARRFRLPAGGRFLCYEIWFCTMRLLVLPLRSLPYPPVVKTLIYPALYLGLMAGGGLLFGRLISGRCPGFLLNRGGTKVSGKS